MADLTAIILTNNEEKNIEYCIRSIQPVAKKIVVIDSFSTDTTVQKAKALGATVYQHDFINQAKQYIYGMSVADIQTTWLILLSDVHLHPVASPMSSDKRISSRNKRVM